MATVEQQPSGTGEMDPSAYDVAIQLVVQGEVHAEELEELSIQIQETIDGMSDDAILGCAVSGKYDPATIEVDLEIDAKDLPTVLTHVVSVALLLQENCPIQIVAKDTRITRTDERELVPC